LLSLSEQERKKLGLSK
jgi:hypothetical protein